MRALVGGVTAIQGTGGQARSYSDEALVRNVDKWIFGKQVGRSLIDLPSGSIRRWRASRASSTGSKPAT